MAIKTEMVNVPGPKGNFEAYLAIPEQTPAPGVVVIQEVFGVNPHIRAVTERLAQEGYVAIAPDLFWPHQHGFQSGYSADEIEVAREIMGKISLDDSVKDVEATMKVLGARPETTDKTGVIGFCWGGLMTYLVAARLNPTAASAYYGGRTASFLDEAKNISAPIIFHFGEEDAGIPMDQVEQVRQAVAGLPNADVYVYPNAGHGFHCDMRGSYHEPSAKLAWERSMDFFRKWLH